MSYQNVNELLNIKETDLEILETRITPYADATAYFNAVDADYNAGKVIPISAMEYKNMVLMEYFIQQIFASGIDKWVNYIPAKSEAMKHHGYRCNPCHRHPSGKKGEHEPFGQLLLAEGTRCDQSRSEELQAPIALHTRTQWQCISHTRHALGEHRLYADDGGQAILLGAKHPRQRN